MYRTLKVALREYTSIVKTKMFIVILVLAPILMSGGLIAAFIAEKNVDTTDKNLVVIDRSKEFGDVLFQAAQARNSSEVYDMESGKKMRPEYILEFVEPDDNDPAKQRLELSNRVREGSIQAFVEIGTDVVHPRNPQSGSINYYGKNSIMDDMRRWLEQPVNNHIRQIRLKEAGVDLSEVQDLFVWQRVSGMGLVSFDEGTGELTDARRSNEIEAFLVPFGLCMFMYFMLILVTQSLLTSVIEEKTQRIAEVLLGSVKPFEFMMGLITSGMPSRRTMSFFGSTFMAGSVTIFPFTIIRPAQIIFSPLRLEDAPLAEMYRFSLKLSSYCQTYNIFKFRDFSLSEKTNPENSSSYPHAENRKQNHSRYCHNTLPQRNTSGSCLPEKHNHRRKNRNH